jgi:bacterioferritin-associated ferredoxin
MTKTTDKVIGANLIFNCHYHDDYELQLLINPKNKLIDFAVNGSDSSFRNTVLELLTPFKNKDVTGLFMDLSSIVAVEDLHLKTVLYQVVQNIQLFIHPIHHNLVDCADRICRCFNIGRSEIEDAIERGASDILTITNLTKAGGACTSCIPDISLMLKEKSDDESASIDEDEHIEISSDPRPMINGKYPYLFLQEDIFPIVDKYNKESGKSAFVVQLIGEHLYLTGTQKISELENFIEKSGVKVSLFYV